MKIFSNFDTGLSQKLHKEAIDKYGEDHVMFIRRDPIYVYLKVYGPLLIRLIFFVVASILWYSFIDTSDPLGTVIFWIVVGIFCLLLLFVLRVAIVKYIDYKMDFMIITPRQVLAYDQEGLLDRLTKTLDLSKIKSIHERKKWLLCSIFNYGSILFFSEGDEQTGDITMNYISSPIEMKEKIAKIIDENYKIHLEEASAHYNKESAVASGAPDTAM